MHQHGNKLLFKVVSASLASLSVVCYLDYITGYDLHFFVFYFLPASLRAWYLGRPTVVMMAVLSGVAWGLTDKLSGHPYASNLAWYWNTSVCFSSVLIQGLVAQWLKFNLNEQKKAREDLARALEQQKQSAAEIQKLQEQSHGVGAWAHWITVGGKWVTTEEFLKNSFTSNWHTGFLRKPSRFRVGKSVGFLNRRGFGT